LARLKVHRGLRQPPGRGERVCPGALQPAVARVRALEAVQQLQVRRGCLRGAALAAGPARAGPLLGRRVARQDGAGQLARWAQRRAVVQSLSRGRWVHCRLGQELRCRRTIGDKARCTAFSQAPPRGSGPWTAP